MELAEQGGFEAVRLRDVASHAGVALGTASTLDGSTTSTVSNNVAALSGGGVCVSFASIDNIDILRKILNEN